MIGVAYSFLTPKTYYSKSVFVPIISENGFDSSLGGLASLAGISLDGNFDSDEISPLLYGRISQSLKFRKQLLSSEIELGGEKITYEEYLTTRYRRGPKQKVRSFFNSISPSLMGRGSSGDNQHNEVDSSSEIFFLTPYEDDLYKIIADELRLHVLEKEGIVELGFDTQNAHVSAQMTKSAKSLLQNEIMRLKTERAKQELDFTKELFEEKKSLFEDVQLRLAEFEDSNRSVSTAVSRLGLDKLRAEYNFSQSVFLELGKQYEQAKLSLERRRPVFRDLEQIIVPIRKSGPKRLVYAVVIAFLGILLLTVVLIYKAVDYNNPKVSKMEETSSD